MFAVLLSGGQNDLIQWQKVIICDSVLCFASPVCPGSWRTRQCSLWPVHQTAGCRAAPYTEWRSPTGWLQRPTRHWLWWIYPEEKNHIWKFNTPTLKYYYFQWLSEDSCWWNVDCDALWDLQKKYDTIKMYDKSFCFRPGLGPLGSIVFSLNFTAAKDIKLMQPHS